MNYISTTSQFLSKSLQQFTRNPEEKLIGDIVFDDSVHVAPNDARLNKIAALTYNSTSADRIFAVLEKTINSSEYPHSVIFKSLLLLNTIALYGSEYAIDKLVKMCPYMQDLPNYNSALVKKSTFGITFNTGGTDHGAGVRAQARILLPLIMDSTNTALRKARADARAVGDNTLVPLGEVRSSASSSSSDPLGIFNTSGSSKGLEFGQGTSKSIGENFGLDKVPGMYEGRPDRYFDDTNDPRSRSAGTRDSQITRDRLAPSLLDLAFDEVGSTELPEAQYLPALERQRELERRLAEQQLQLSQLQQLQQQQQQQQQQQLLQQQQQQQKPNVLDLLNLSAPVYSSSPGQAVFGIPGINMTPHGSMPMQQGYLPQQQPLQYQYPQRQQQQQQGYLPQPLQQQGLYHQPQQPGYCYEPQHRGSLDGAPPQPFQPQPAQQMRLFEDLHDLPAHAPPPRPV